MTTPITIESCARWCKRVAMLGAAILLTAAASTAVPQAASAGPAVEVEGTEFKVTLADGRVLRSSALVGTVLMLRSGLEVRIEAVERDHDHRGRPIWLHTLAARHADGTSTNLCLVGPDGRRAGFPVPGRALADGTLAEGRPGDFEISCTAGALAKCVRFGYRPWEIGPDGRPLRGLFNACIHMVRGDYGGDGRATTRDGTTIDVYDAWRIQTPDMDDAHDFEAGWGPEGAVCVRHPRIKEHVSLDDLERAYPRLQGLTGAVCTEELARAHGARLFNRSRP